MAQEKEYRKVIACLREMISSGRLQIGSKLPAERELAEKLAVSRNSIREALRVLENTGIIECRHGSGNYLASHIEQSMADMIDMMLLLKQTDQAEICAFRRSLDKAVCSLLLDHNPDITCLKEAEKLCQFPEKTGNPEELIEQDRQFHYLLIKATGNQLWISIAEAAARVYRRWIDAVLSRGGCELVSEISKAHQGIIHGVMTCDRKACESWIDRHYDLVERELNKK